jgi:MFS family permease
MRPRLAVPPRQRSLFAGVVAAFVAAWTLGGFYQSLGPRFARDLLYGDTYVFAGLVVASVLAVTATGGPLTGALAPRRATLVGLATLAVGTVTLVWALSMHQTAAFFVASFVAGAGFGAATTGAMRSLLADVHNTEVAGIFSAVYLVSYLGAAVPAFLGGRLIPPFGLMKVTVGYAGLVLALALAAAVIVTVTGRAADRGSAQDPGAG